MLKKKKMMRIFNKIYKNYKKMLFKIINKNMKSKKIIKLYPNNNKKVLHIYLQKLKIQILNQITVLNKRIKI